MPRNWREEKATPAKRTREEGEEEEDCFPIIREKNYQICASTRHQKDTIASKDVPRLRKELRRLKYYREIADGVTAEPQSGRPGEPTKADFAYEGAVLIPIVDGRTGARKNCCYLWTDDWQ